MPGDIIILHMSTKNYGQPKKTSCYKILPRKMEKYN